MASKENTPDSQSLQAFLVQKGLFMDKWFKCAQNNDLIAIKKPKALTIVEGRSGVRRINIRNHQIIADSPPEWAGYNLGPSAPEIVLGGLGACISHMFLVVAGLKNLPINKLEVETSGELDLRKGGIGHEHETPGLDNIHYTVRIDTKLTDSELNSLRTEVEKVCPMYNVIKNPQTITSSFVRIDK
ncbi:hypothetical protein C6P40_000364 [Pichia californica]|uniref:OsmC-like protein n=1 Tax=Pichia californica TaxID=460514 RepID=A0A9P7BG91_9ASCO|nr:hypothetical protein C6P42_000344 [[Candida] californica]KAG0688925.1 hypothetical protein C6P40_000364 [[Candida] californica]